MAHEASKVRKRFLPLLQGQGIDIGCGDDPITDTCVAWDLPQGDAQTMPGQRAESYDWIFSSHCLEHMPRPLEALLVWWRLLRPGGTLVLIVPDEDAYEAGCWPSALNSDHKATFTPSKWRSWSPASLNLTDLIAYLPDHKLLSMQVVDTRKTFDRDETLHGELAHIECVLRKGPDPARQTLLGKTLVCPRCGRELLLRGIEVSGALALQCATCGNKGTYVHSPA